MTLDARSDALVEEELKTEKEENKNVNSSDDSERTVSSCNNHWCIQEVEYTNYEYFSVPEKQTGFKSWMPYTALSKNSPNYKLLKTKGKVDSNGLWQIDGYYCVALGSYYSKSLGNIFELQLSSGNKITVITVDHKADIHTDSTNRVTKTNGCIVEFIVDKTKLNSTIKTTGSVGSLTEFSGTVVSIAKIGNIFD
nr:hypothetical protein DGKKSRWO_DGKKSRWO_CDS_0012 [uncultured phage]CAI9752119.1 hypothetical protein CVNMHQAP_CVNMHQAP_CDS_0012 [uncultured phage]